MYGNTGTIKLVANQCTDKKTRELSKTSLIMRNDWLHFLRQNVYRLEVKSKTANRSFIRTLPTDL